MSDERAQIVFGANITDITNKLLEAQVATKEAVEGINASLNTVKESFTGLGEAFAALMAVEMFEHMIEETASLASHLEVLSQKTGMAVEDLSRLRYAADLSHIGVDTLDTGMARLARSMQDAAKGGVTPGAEAFKALGLSATDADGKMRPMRDVFLEVAEKFSSYEDGAAKSALAMNLFGRSGAELVPLLNKGAEGIKELGLEQDKLNATMTTAQKEVATEYENHMKRMEASIRGVKQNISLALMPTLGALAEAFTHTGGSSELFNGTMEVVAGALRFVGTVAVVLKGIIVGTYETFRWVFEEIATAFAGLSLAFVALLKGDFTGAAAHMKDTWAEMGYNVLETNQNLKRSADETVDSLKRLYGFKNDAEAAPESSKPKKDAPLIAKAGKEKSDALAAAREEWAEIAAASEDGKDTLLEIEMDFWQQKMATADRSTKEGVKLYREYHKQLLAAVRTYNADAKREAQIDVQTVRDSALEQLDVDKQAIQERRALREIDAKAAGQLLQANADLAFELKRSALDEEMALAEGDLVKQAQIRQKEAALERSHSKEVSGIHKQTTVEIAKDWEKTFSTITDTIRTSFDGVIRGTQTLADAMHNLFRGITLNFVAGKLEELKVHTSTELAKRGITTATATHSVAMHSWAAIQSVAVTVWAALKNIAAYAAEAAAATWKAIASIPFVGPFLAPAAAVAALAGVMALGGSIASAAGGYDIPAGLNPMTQLHAQEMVLPADLANRVRGMTDGDGSGETHFHVHAIDAKGVKQFMMEHRDHLHAAVKQALKDGRA
jgi:hypothetical protein